MLKYNIKLTDGNFRQEELVWREKYLSPDLSFVSGVTSQDHHLEKFNKLNVSNTILNTPTNVLPLESENVKRQGYALIKGKEYKVNSGSVIDYSIESSGTPISYNYIFLNGKYYYRNDNNEFKIDNWLVEDYDGIIESSITISSDNEIAKIDTIAWIEDGSVNIDGYEYIYDFEQEGIKYTENGEILLPSSITQCDDIVYKPYVDYVTKFKLLKGNNESNHLFESVSFVKYYYYIKYKEKYFTIYKDGDYFYCDIPTNIIDGTSDLSAITTVDVYYANDINLDDVIEDVEISGRTFDVLQENTCYVKIEDGNFYVENEILNANDGREIAIYLEDEHNTIMVGDRLRFVTNFYDEYIDTAYDIGDDNFIIHNGNKYKIKQDLCNTVNIDGTNFNINYINGEKNGKDCLVLINDEEVPMEIVDGGLKRYGKVMTNSTVLSATVSSVTYTVTSHSGVTINGRNFIIENEDGETKYIITEFPKEYSFVVSNIIGSSMIVCKPAFDKFDYPDEFIEEISNTICEDVVTNQTMFSIYSNDNVFGNREITEELAFNYTNNPTSSDDYFNLFDNFRIFTNNGYIHIPLSLNMPQGNNLIQDEIVKRDFFEYEKKKRINPIIDMEKDVYLPKSFDGEYNGSNTDFKEIEEIRINLHFRTRNLESWKVNESYNNISTEELCNWFITDFYPYKKMLESEREKELINASDLMGLLYFTNNDVFYQKSKIGKSFLRLSFYDSTNPQDQMLLATSTVFMDEHRMFKRYIDNSRKNENRFITAEESEEDLKLHNKISVKGELYENDELNIDSYQNYVRIDDEHRVGSEFIIKNKYETDTSSEGYYLYIFREYSEKLVPKPIYMKVEFNHAGIGRTIPFIVPMKWDVDVDADGNKFPQKALSLEESDLEELKRGIKLEDANEQMYIPLYAVYDFKHKEYAYVFDDRYANVDENGKLTLNLFEIKFANDTEGELDAEITNGIQPTAKINVNTNQFPNAEWECQN